MIELKSASEVAALREAGKVVARALASVRATADVGVTLRDLDRVAADVIAEAGAVPSFLHYLPHFAATPYPAVICSSVNDAIVHGIPTKYRLRDGDLVSIDCGAHLDGWCGDSAISFTVGTSAREDADLIAAAEQALQAGIEASVPGNHIGDIGNAVGPIARAAGYGILAGYGGHGVGRAMHEDPHIPNEGRPGKGLGLRPGMVIAIEPMFIIGGNDEHWTDKDGWTLRSKNGGRAAHVEHTIAITEDGPVVLTAP